MKLSNLLCAYEREMGTVCDSKRCTAQAIKVVVLHMIDSCSGQMPNMVYLMCEPCARRTVANAGDSMARMKEALRHKDKKARLECTTCGRHIKRVADLCRIERLINV
jgi:hypothetical protein